jgi:hypothetical protein
MTVRLFIFIPLTVFSLFMVVASLAWGGGALWFFSGCSLIGIYAIWHTLSHPTRFKVTGHALVLESALGNTQQHDLMKVSDWKEFEMNIRAQRRKTLVLFVNNEKVIVDNSEHKIEFEELFAYLLNTHADKRRE